MFSDCGSKWVSGLGEGEWFTEDKMEKGQEEEIQRQPNMQAGEMGLGETDPEVEHGALECVSLK